MFILNTYTTDREDLDLMANIILDYGETREELIEPLIKEVVNDCYNYDFEIYSSDFEDTFSNDDLNNGKSLEDFIKAKFADTDVKCLSINVNYCLSSGVSCNYENTYTINDTSKCIRTRCGETLKNKKGETIYP